MKTPPEFQAAALAGKYGFASQASAEADASIDANEAEVANHPAENDHIEFGYTVKIDPRTGDEISDCPRGSVFLRKDYREWTANDADHFPNAANEIDAAWRLIVCVSTGDVYAVGKFENVQP